MDRLYILIIFLLGVIDISHVQISGSALEFTVTLGDNITLYCDRTASSGVYIKWYRRCSHLNQPSLVLNTRYPHEELIYDYDSNDFLNPIPRFILVKNQTSNSYDLLIVNITESDEGLYYCGTEEVKVEAEEKLIQKYVYSYSNVTTRIKLFEPYSEMNSQACGVCWTLLFYLCPAVAVCSSLLSSLLVYHLSKKTGFAVSGVDSDAEYIATAKQRHIDKKRRETRGHAGGNQDEDVCYAALEIRQASQKSKKTNQSSEFCAYSDISTCRM